MNTRRLTFDDLLVQAIDESLSVIGDEPKRALYQYLLSIHSLRQEDIPIKIEQFTIGIRHALGSASKVIEKLILRRLYEKMGTTHQESQTFDFKDYIEDARQRFALGGQGPNDAGDGADYVPSKKAQSSS